MNIYGQLLSINFKPHLDLISQLEPTVNTKSTAHFLIKKEDRDHRVVELIESLGFGVHHSELFYTPAYSTRNIHVDGDIGNPPYASIFKINWIVGGTGSRMVWYETIDGYSPEKRKTVAGTYACIFDPKKCREIFNLQIENCALVQAGIPHTVINERQPRWAVSYVVSLAKNSGTLQSPSVSDLEQKFKEFLI